MRSQATNGINYSASRLVMSMVLLLLLGWLVCIIQLWIQAEVFASDEVAPEKGAVCELDEQEFTIRGKNSAVLRVRRIFRIYNDAGRKYGVVFTWQNKFVKVDKMEAELRDSAGEVIKKLREEGIQEASWVPGYVLYADGSTKYFDLAAATFPYTLEYSYETKYKSLFYWPSWTPQLEIPVERSAYTLIVPKDFAFQMYQHNLELEPIERVNKGKREVAFELTQLPAFEPEEKMPPERNHLMAVFFAPAEFDLDGYKGSMDSWESVGAWYASLARKQYKLSSQNRRAVAEMVSHCASAEDTVKAVYQFIQRKTRYVAIHMGIGGYKPHQAESVMKYGYGDCKDLVTLFVTILKSVGMTVHPVLIRTGSEGEVLVDFPSNQFNHIIACVPLGQDTLWLDCTCNYCPLGELPWYDEGCHSLVVMEDTSVMVKTPTSSAQDNRLARSIHASLAGDGSLEIRGNLRATGNFELHYRQLLNSYSARERKEWLTGLFAQYSPNQALLDSDFRNLDDPELPLSVEFTAKLISYATLSGGELLLNLNLLSRVDAEELPREEDRAFPVDNQYAYTTEDEVVLEFPRDFAVKVLPEGKEILDPFASFRTWYSVDNNRLTYRRTKIMNQDSVPPASFGEYKEFIEGAYRSDHSFVILFRRQ